MPGRSQVSIRQVPRLRRTGRKPTARNAGPSLGGSSIGPASTWTNMRDSHADVISSSSIGRTAGDELLGEGNGLKQNGYCAGEVNFVIKP